jgi:predicted small lipoprotein YifL
MAAMRARARFSGRLGGSVALASVVACGARTPLRVPDADRDVARVDAATDVPDARDVPAVTDVPTDVVAFAAGCADGQREAFTNRVRYPRIAGCAGGFTLPGVRGEAPPSCGRAGGDDGRNPVGAGCNAGDLCAAGWHVCRSAGDVSDRAIDGCAGARDAGPGTFFATRQSGPGCYHCSNGDDPTCGPESCRPGCRPTAQTANDVFGCGTVGSTAAAESCGVLDRMGDNDCVALPPPWRCPDGPALPANEHESENVIKPGSEAGGVLCCAD